MKKIVLVTDVWLKNVNGVSKALCEIKKGLEASGFEVTMIHPGLFTSIPLPVYPEIKLALLSGRKMERILKEVMPDYIHIATEGTLGLSARLVCMKNNWRFTTFYHTRLPEFADIYLKALKKTTYNYLRWFHKPSSNTNVTTTSLQHELEDKGFGHVVVSPLGVDTDLFKKNSDAKIPDGLTKPIFVFLGRVGAEKNIEAFLGCDLPGSKLVIGDGPHKKKLEKKYKGKAVFAGFQQGQELVDLLSICDVLVFPSKTDTFGLVIIEALACGLPVAAFNVQGPKDIITNGVDGFLGDDLEKNARACLKLDPKNCRKKAVEFSWEIATKKFIDNLVHRVA